MIKIKDVAANSVAAKNQIQAGDILLSINGRKVHDIIDYQYFVTEEKLNIRLLRAEKEFSVALTKPQYEDLGLEFDTYLMDEKRRCKNNCVFCFIDQNPKGMRETIYFKDDDERLSFLFGNYVTLTNLKESDIERIIEMRITPINISVHTTNPELRVKMMRNKHAGESLSILKRFTDAGIAVNAQIVLCRDYNDGAELTRTMNDLKALFPGVQSVSIVPSGITKYREGLAKLLPFDKESARITLEQVISFGDECVRTLGHRIFFPSDEFFVLAEMAVPDESFYEGYMQLDNGVGMLRLLREEFMSALEYEERLPEKGRTVTVVTGKSAFKEISGLCKAVEEKYSENGESIIKINVIAIRNDFYGDTITVAGLVVGSDIAKQLKDKDLGDEVLIPSSMLRSEGDLFLDDMHIDELADELGVTVTPVDDDGGAFLDAILGL